MKYSILLGKKYSSYEWICGDTYESLIWKDTSRERPTQEEFNMQWDELKKMK